MPLRVKKHTRFSKKCLELWEEWQPDVIHVNDRHTWMPFRYLPNTVYSLHLSMSDLVGMRGMDHYWFHELKQDKDACAKASALIVYSKFMQKVVWDKLCDFASPLVLPLGFVPEAFHFNKPPEKIVVSYFGRLAQNQKGFVEFVQAVDMINQDLLSRYTVEFNIYGVGDFPEWLPSRRINTVKHLDKDEVKEAYAESHVVVMPSKYEPFGLVGLEAIASGCVLFCTTGLGMDEYIVENKNFVPIESDPYNIKDNLENFLQNPGKYLGREKVISETVKDWTWERCAQEHLKVYHQVAVGRAGMLKWSHGQQAETAKKAWERTGDLRKKKLKEVFNKASQWISGEKVLVINGTEDEVATYKNTGKEIIHHRFVPNSDSQISFQTEYILVAPDSVEQTVFIYGPEYAPHLQYTIQELHRITKDSVIFGISFGERTFGKNSIFKSKENLLKYIDGILSFEKIEEEFLPLKIVLIIGKQSWDSFT
jgi:glycosyltransferase involved in cell wall biosynthesis